MSFEIRKPSVFIAFILLFVGSFVRAHASDFNDNWRFILDDNPKFSTNDLDDKSWQILTLPHDWSILQPFSKELNGATAYLPGGIGWYRKSFKTQIDSDKEKQFLYFDGIYNHSEIFLNGERIGGMINGYTPFYIEISKYLQPTGQENVLAIRVDRRRYIDSRWYTGSGIYRDVKLITKDKLHIPIWGVQFLTPKVGAQWAHAEVNIDVQNDFNSDKTFELRAKLSDQQGKVVATAKRDISLSAKASVRESFNLAVVEPQLWSPDTPHRYQLTTQIYVDDKLVDQQSQAVGFRSLQFNADSGFWLNGKNLKIKGVNLHHDAGAVGVAVADDVWRRRFAKLKEAGVNAIRTAHNPMSERFLELTDEMGFLVQGEIFDEWDNPKDKRLNQWERHDDLISRGYADYFQENAEIDLKNAVLRDRNRVSIIMWSIGNEIEWTYPRYKQASGYFDMNAKGNYFYNPPFIEADEIKKRFFEQPAGEYVLADTAKKLSKWVKEVDDSRPVTANLILPSVSHVSGYTDALDIIGYSYRRVIYDYGHQRYPDKMIMGTENVVQWHEWKAIEERPFIAGTFLWTGIDYLGEAHDRWPGKNIDAGMLDTAGFAKPAFHLYKTLWQDKPHAHITTQSLDASSYTMGKNGEFIDKREGGWRRRVWGWYDVNRHWNYQDNEPVIVEVLSNCPTLDLRLNGKSLGKKRLLDFPDKAYKWLVPFSAGTLSVSGDNNCEAIDNVATAGSPKIISASTDISELAQDNNRVAHIEIQLLDDKGNPVSHAEQEVTLELSANLQMVASDNGNSATLASYQSDTLNTHQGRGLFIVKRIGTGEALVTIKGKDLKSQRLKLH
ncbi:glycoside hydrolase family 2 TIM barrel-domain containing protein [Thalassotalea sp. PS06]|uniref:glycoside hydrolase family 2 TIM barrel-domain containing protein n=1 Tax=Thalassotalea sp. PS06 TaxID=2594005 RepID=UPI001163B720|nr:glycoside hydrolase family 2 TIM barrel-domain containing protein [Thalassotalea sp. PS06]QDP02177.1 glycoside hydrolase family 2 protein [Thalassotalea sp. PS06]